MVKKLLSVCYRSLFYINYIFVVTGDDAGRPGVFFILLTAWNNIHKELLPVKIYHQDLNIVFRVVDVLDWLIFQDLSLVSSCITMPGHRRLRVSFR